MGNNNTKPKGKDKNNDKSSKSEKNKEYDGFLKDIDTSKLNHELNDDINKYFEITDKILGMGNFSVVKLGVHKKTRQRCAIKIIDKTLSKNKPELLKNEVDILLKVNHPNIVGMIDLFDSDEKIVRGGELFDRIVEREQFTEKQSAHVMKQLFQALSYLHSLGIVHRDLKPENLLLEDEKSDTVKIADFGLSKIYTEEMLSTACGTPGYVAPEILSCERYDKQIDMWSCGVIMYILLCGYPPFYNEHEQKLFEAIMAGHFEFHSPFWDDISEDAKDLIRKLLVVDPSKRLTSEEALKHKWFSTTGENKKNHKYYKEKLKSHNVDRKASMAAMKQSMTK